MRNYVVVYYERSGYWDFLRCELIPRLWLLPISRMSTSTLNEWTFQRTLEILLFFLIRVFEENRKKFVIHTDEIKELLNTYRLLKYLLGKSRYSGIIVSQVLTRWAWAGLTDIRFSPYWLLLSSTSLEATTVCPHHLDSQTS